MSVFVSSSAFIVLLLAFFVSGFAFAFAFAIGKTNVWGRGRYLHVIPKSRRSDSVTDSQSN